VLFLCLLHRPGVLQYHLKPKMTVVLRRVPLLSTTSSAHCTITIELVAYAFATATNGFKAIGVLRSLKFMHYRRFGIYVQELSRNLMILRHKILQFL
jgi:hypothetical protein